MTTKIELEAKKKGEYFCGWSSVAIQGFIQGYVQGAAAQRKRDIKNASDLMITALNEGLISTSDIGKLNMWLRKAMEE